MRHLGCDWSSSPYRTFFALYNWKIVGDRVEEYSEDNERSFWKVMWNGIAGLKDLQRDSAWLVLPSGRNKDSPSTISCSSVMVPNDHKSEQSAIRLRRHVQAHSSFVAIISFCEVLSGQYVAARR
jgi:hypothetical protein